MKVFPRPSHARRVLVSAGVPVHPELSEAGGAADFRHRRNRQQFLLLQHDLSPEGLLRGRFSRHLPLLTHPNEFHYHGIRDQCPGQHRRGLAGPVPGDDHGLGAGQRLDQGLGVLPDRLQPGGGPVGVRRQAGRRKTRFQFQEGPDDQPFGEPVHLGQDPGRHAAPDPSQSHPGDIRPLV